ncbi:MAG: hypothetical protein AAF862_12970 [Pseudomonadota bacterium]
MKFVSFIVAATAAAWALPSAAMPITPTSNVGLLPGFPGVGMGIPNDRVAFQTFQLDFTNDTLTLGIAATGRFDAPQPSDDGNGTYFARTGTQADPMNPSSLGAKWNFTTFARVDDGGDGFDTDLDFFGITFLYDLDPAFGTDIGDLLSPAISLPFGQGVTQAGASQNLLFSFWNVGNVFNPNTPGEYSFVLGSEFGEVAMNVVVSPIPVPGAAVLFASAVLGAGLMQRRRPSA